jgi:hypothetical protein
MDVHSYVTKFCVTMRLDPRHSAAFRFELDEGDAPLDEQYAIRHAGLPWRRQPLDQQSSGPCGDSHTLAFEFGL